MSTRIVVVCDDALLRRAIGRVIRARRLEWSVALVASVAELEPQLENGRVDAVVCDVFNDEGEGMAALRRTREAFPEVARVAYASRACVELPEVCQAHAMVRSPASVVRLLAGIDQALERVQPEEGGRRPFRTGRFATNRQATGRDAAAYA